MRFILVLLVASLCVVAAQPNVVGPMMGQQPWQQQQFGVPLSGWTSSGFQQQYPQVLGQQPILGGYGGMQQQPILGGFGGVQQPQPILGGIGIGQQYPTIPQTWSNFAGQVPLMQQQPLNLGNVGVGQFGQQFGQGIPIQTGFGGIQGQVPMGYTGTVGPVLPQNYGNPSASFGQLGQPVLSPQQLTQIVPTAQLQQALDQRVAGLGRV